MRWSNLAADAPPGTGAPDRAAPAAPPLPLALPDATVRTADAPGFAGMTFYEVRARTILNRVPAGSRAPSEWTLNPYRGCSHACTYCLAGDTPVLLADGSARPLAALRRGDAVLGTAATPAGRRWAATTVLDHWSTRRPAYRVTLADGTRLVAGGGHRFLTARGWRHVHPDDPRCPALAAGDRLAGVGRLAEPPKDSPDHRAGYLCGLLRGDAAAAVSRGGAPWAHAERLRHGTALPEALRWPRSPTDDWYRGFLAGAFGAVGHAEGLAVVLAARDGAYLDRVGDALARLGLVARRRAGAAGAAARVSTAADPWTALRFRHLTGVSTAPLDLTGLPVRHEAASTVVEVAALGLTLPLFDLTTGTGDFVADGVVSHNCFARGTHEYLGLGPGHDFDTRVVVKVNAGELLRRELAAPSWRGARVAMGTNVDVYQRAEGRYRLMRPILAALRDAANPFSVLTKGTLILRDLDLLTEAARVTSVGLSFSVGTVDPAVWRTTEPGTPDPRRRLDAVRTLADAGFAVHVLMAPILPGLGDSAAAVDATVAAIAAAGAVSVTPTVLHLRPGARAWYADRLARHHPGLRPRYRELYGAGSYAPRAYQREVAERVRRAARRHGLPDPGPHPAPRTRPPAGAPEAGAPAGPHEQLTLL